ncbi:MAG: hypothetical protein V5A42_04040 [Halofilum sp. (in: g-proteobacteria)]
MSIVRTSPRILPAVALFLAVLAMPATAVAEAWTVEASAWARPRDGRAVLTMAPLPTVVRAWSRRSGAQLVVRYAGGESGELWAAELGDWLVALGVPGSAITLSPGGRPEHLELEIKKGGGT